MNKATPEVPSSCPSDLQLDAFQLSPGGGEEALKAHLEQCADCSKRWRERRALDDVGRGPSR